MKKLVQTLQEIWSIDELRGRILNTVLFLAVFRIGSYIVLPGVDATKLKSNTGGVFGLLDTFLGGAFNNASIFALGIMPYISASIVLQLLTVTVPYFTKISREGESGRRTINQWTRFLTIFLAIAQSVGYISGTIEPEAIRPEFNGPLFTISSIVLITAGTMFCMWMGERITDKGIGNGISMLIMIGIISRFPGAIVKEAASRGMSQALLFIIELLVLFAVVLGVVMLTQAVRRIPIQYAKQVIGNKVYGGQRQFLPLKLNSAGVMPIIFAQSIMFLPTLLAGAVADKSEIAATIGTIFSDFTSWPYNILFGLLIVIFTYFYTAISISPTQIADDMKRNNGFIPGVKPGEETVTYIDQVLSRITLPGALFLFAIAIMPALAGKLGVVSDFASFFGGTSLLIMVGVVLDTLQQVESYLLMRQYEGLMKNSSESAAAFAGDMAMAS